MADFDGSMPIRTEADGDIAAKISDATVPSQQLKVNADGSIDVNAAITTPNLDASTDNVAISDGTDTLAVNTDGSINITDNGGSITVDAANLDIRDLTFANDKVDATGSEVSLDAATLAALETTTVVATDLDIRSLVAATDSVSAHLKDEAGAAYSSTNPLPVFVEGSAGAKVTDYNTTTALVKDATVTHTYTVTAAKTFCGEEVFVSGSVRLRVEVKIGAATIFVAFNSVSNPNVRIPLDKAVEAAAGVDIDILITNRENQAQDVYSTLTGTEK